MGGNFGRILTLIPMVLAIGAMSASAAPILLITFENDCPAAVPLSFGIVNLYKPPAK